jgi:hypothetical protein
LEIKPNTKGYIMKINNDKQLKLSTAEKWLFLGHVCSSLGLLLISIGTSLRLAEEGKLPTAMNSIGQNNTDQLRPRATDYFS